MIHHCTEQLDISVDFHIFPLSHLYFTQQKTYIYEPKLYWEKNLFFFSFSICVELRANAPSSVTFLIGISFFSISLLRLRQQKKTQLKSKWEMMRWEFTSYFDLSVYTYIDSDQTNLLNTLDTRLSPFFKKYIWMCLKYKGYFEV